MFEGERYGFATFTTGQFTDSESSDVRSRKAVFIHMGVEGFRSLLDEMRPDVEVVLSIRPGTG